TASELWHPNDSQTPPLICQHSDQFRVHGHPDWETLEQWYAIQGLAGRPGLTPLTRPSSSPLPKPEDAATWGPLADVAGQSPVGTLLHIPALFLPGTPPPPPTVVTQTLFVKVSQSVALTESVASQFYLLHSNGDPFAVDRILYEGNVHTSTLHSPTVLGQIDLL